jgi:hypothetical protein
LCSKSVKALKGGNIGSKVRQFMIVNGIVIRGIKVLIEGVGVV